MLELLKLLMLVPVPLRLLLLLLCFFVLCRVRICGAICFYSRRFQIFGWVRRPPHRMHGWIIVLNLTNVYNLIIHICFTFYTHHHHCTMHLYRRCPSMSVQHLSHANPWCCWSHTFFNTKLDLAHLLHWNLRISLLLLSFMSFMTSLWYCCCCIISSRASCLNCNNQKINIKIDCTSMPCHAMQLTRINNQCHHFTLLKSTAPSTCFASCPTTPSPPCTTQKPKKSSANGMMTMPAMKSPTTSLNGKWLMTQPQPQPQPQTQWRMNNFTSICEGWLHLEPHSHLWIRMGRTQ